VVPVELREIELVAIWIFESDEGTGFAFVDDVALKANAFGFQPADGIAKRAFELQPDGHGAFTFRRHFRRGTFDQTLCEVRYRRERRDELMNDKEDTKSIEARSNAISRRDLIKGVIVGGVAVSSASYLFRASTLLGQSPRGMGERLVTIDVNGQLRRADVMRQETLAWTLRHKLGLTGTKLGCDRAECGSCTVLIDDVPHYACSVLTHTVRDRKVLTVEGLASPEGKLHPVQQGVIDEQGFQCAFCMPGFIMASVGFLKTNPNPTRSELAFGVSGNLCRCQDYDKILTALMRGAENMRRASNV
jgi:aerobic-type carbon monoxide dehydrogenase small subunit (CoxS/CutS family)